jgi:hypothetical protein
VRIAVDSITLRGTHRDSVVLDGELERPVGITITGRGVEVARLTVRRHAESGVAVTDARAFRIRDVAATQNGAQGIVLTRSTEGVVEDGYVAGSAEAGLVVRDCAPCRILVRRTIGEHNGVGALALNAGGDLSFVEGIWRLNRAGIVLTADPATSAVLPQAVLVRANLVQGNHSRTAPGTAAYAFAWGNGVVVAGGREHRIFGNAFAFHAGHGILVAPLGPGAAENVGIRIGENRFAKSGRGDVSIGGPSGSASCVSMAAAALRTAPQWLTCGATMSVIAERDLVPVMTAKIRAWRHGSDAYPDWRTLELPSAPSMPPAPDTASLPTAVAALARQELSLPGITDSVVLAALQREGPPIHVSPLGLRLASVQSYFPLTRGGLVIGALLVVAVALLLRRRIITALVGAAYLGWVGLAAAVAVLLSST